MPTASINGTSIDNSYDFDQPVAPFNEVKARFDETLAMANDMMDLLVGADGAGGYLGDLNAVISSALLLQ